MSYVACAECVYWRTDGGLSDSGQCARRAPRPALSSEEDVYVEARVIWPLTLFSEGCGEGEKRERKG